MSWTLSLEMSDIEAREDSSDEDPNHTSTNKEMENDEPDISGDSDWGKSNDLVEVPETHE